MLQNVNVLNVYTNNTISVFIVVTTKAKAVESWPNMASCPAWYTHKTSGFKTSGFKTSGFKTSETSGLQNVWFAKRQVYKTSGLENIRLQNVRFQNVNTRKYYKISVFKEIY
jgi:hypothetical protein